MAMRFSESAQSLTVARREGRGQTQGLKGSLPESQPGLRPLLGIVSVVGGAFILSLALGQFAPGASARIAGSPI